jgi:hypothetical protein
MHRKWYIGMCLSLVGSAIAATVVVSGPALASSTPGPKWSYLSSPSAMISVGGLAAGSDINPWNGGD